MNYLTHSMPDLQEWISYFKKNSLSQSAFSLENLCTLMKSAERFSLPKGGSLFDTDFHGLKDVFPRLPYPVMIMEYEAEHNSQDDVCILPTDISSKRIVFAIEHSSEIMKGMSKYLGENVSFPRPSYEDGMIQIMCIDYFPKFKKWTPCYTGAAIPFERGGSVLEEEIRGKGHDIALKFKVVSEKNSPLPYLWTPFPFLPEIFMKKYKEEGHERFHAYAIKDIGQEVHTTFSLLEALSCINVKTETINPPEKLNKKRIENGNLPFLSYKTLVLEVPKNSKTEVPGTGSHASPRMHLRRGHIRRLDETRRIWVNSCVVGRPENGVVIKDYKVQKGRQ